MRAGVNAEQVTAGSIDPGGAAGRAYAYFSSPESFTGATGCSSPGRMSRGRRVPVVCYCDRFGTGESSARAECTDREANVTSTTGIATRRCMQRWAATLYMAGTGLSSDPR